MLQERKERKEHKIVAKMVRKKPHRHLTAVLKAGRETEAGIICREMVAQG